MPRSKKDRIEIPPELAAQVLFYSDRTCCVCRTKGKPTQIHHIDDDPANNVLNNLAVLCFDCHTETQIRGGFHRKLDAEQVILYRDDWVSSVARMRAVNPNRLLNTDLQDQAAELELATSLAEIYRDREEYELLALHYLGLGNDELRDKYIELAIQQGLDNSDLIFFRSVQGRLELVQPEVINHRIRQLKEREDWFGLGRLYVTLEKPQEAAQATCQGAITAISEGNLFSAAFHLKEMVEANVLENLFIASLHQARERDDLWWQYRTLQELEWHSEADGFLMEHREEIEAADEPRFLEELAAALGDKHRYIELRKEEAQAISAKRDSENRPWPQDEDTEVDLDLPDATCSSSD